MANMANTQTQTLQDKIDLLTQQVNKLTKIQDSKQEFLHNLQQEILEGRKEEYRIKDEISDLKQELKLVIEKNKPLNECIDISTNQPIPNELIDRELQQQRTSKWYYNLSMFGGTGRYKNLKPIFPFTDNRGTPKFYIDSHEDTIRVNVKDLQLGDIIRNNFSNYHRDLPEYCFVNKITASQVQFHPFVCEQVGYEGDQHSFNEYWFKFSEVLDSNKKAHRMNMTSSWRKVISDNKIDKYVGHHDNMYSSHKYDGGA